MLVSYWGSHTYRSRRRLIDCQVLFSKGWRTAFSTFKAVIFWPGEVTFMQRYFPSSKTNGEITLGLLLHSSNKFFVLYGTICSFWRFTTSVANIGLFLQQILHLYVMFSDYSMSQCLLSQIQTPLWLNVICDIFRITVLSKRYCTQMHLK